MSMLSRRVRMRFNYMNAIRGKKFPAKFKWQGQFSVFGFQLFASSRPRWVFGFRSCASRFFVLGLFLFEEAAESAYGVGGICACASDLVEPAGEVPAHPS